MRKKFRQTPSQTVGPFFAYGLTPRQYDYPFTSIADNHLYKNTAGQRIILRGQVFDGNQDLVTDALVEIRQDASPDGFGRMGTGTEADHSFIFHTLKPKATGGEAAHINVIVMMRGLLSHLFTRIYFSDEAEANAKDPVLGRVPEDRRQTLIARRKDANGQVIYTFDIHMQGERETVFFDA